jgi:hypothetical protein
MLECTEPGGVMIMLSESREGFGSPETEKQITGYDNMPDRESSLREKYSIGAHTGYLFADTAEKYTFIFLFQRCLQLNCRYPHIACRWVRIPGTPIRYNKFRKCIKDQ